MPVEACQARVVEEPLVSRATAAATALVARLSLPADQATVIHNSNKLALRILPCDVHARVALVGHECAEMEVEIAQALAQQGSPVAALDPRVEPRVYRSDGFAITLWTSYDVPAVGTMRANDYAAALHRLHLGMRTVTITTPHFLDRVAEAEGLVGRRDLTPALPETDRTLLTSTLQSARLRIRAFGAVEQLLHGEPHPGNVLATRVGPLFIDLETCCRGPVEFDIAHVPHDVSLSYPDIDQDLLDQCRRLVLAMVCAWRWDVYDEFPNGLQHGRRILELLRAGPPWPTLD